VTGAPGAAIRSGDGRSADRVLQRRTALAIAGAAITAALLDILQLSRPGYLFGITPDVSVWLGAATRLVHGAVPYRDYVFDQPPGVVLLLSPFALLSKLVGTRDALAALRLCTPVLAAGGVVLVGRLVRHRGFRATLAACACMALYPAVIYALNAGLLEPVEDLLLLGGLALMFEGDRLSGRRRLALAGCALGLAVVVKASAVVPVAVVAIFCALVARRRLPHLAAGIVAGIAVPSLPFFILAPAALIKDVVATQLARVPDTGRASIVNRLARMTFGGNSHGALALAALAIALLYAAVVVAGLVRRRRPRLTAFDWLVLAAFAAVFAEQFGPSQYYLQYAALLSPFAAILLGLSLARLGPWRATRRQAAACGAALLAIVASEMAVIELSSTQDVGGSVAAVVPAGACALSDTASLLVTTDRFVSGVAGCTEMTDPYGTTLRFAADPRGGRAVFGAALSHADYLVLDETAAQWLDGPCAPLRTYVADEFRLHRSGPLDVYVRNGFPAGAGP
jgi:hypothetical protein